MTRTCSAELRGFKCGGNSIVMGITCDVLETTGPVGAHAELDAELRPDGR